MPGKLPLSYALTGSLPVSKLPVTIIAGNLRTLPITSAVVYLLSSMSRENLLTMRPRGVRSKKETGALMTAENKQS